jgi:hypothetical protein
MTKLPPKDQPVLGWTSEKRWEIVRWNGAYWTAVDRDRDYDKDPIERWVWLPDAPGKRKTYDSLKETFILRRTVDVSVHYDLIEPRLWGEKPEEPVISAGFSNKEDAMLWIKRKYEHPGFRSYRLIDETGEDA